tara:strand:- start:114 stop:1322 length:1209 start_codon:yes stop_codon:yes gene_type:complete
MAEKDIGVLKIESPELFQGVDLDGDRIDDDYVFIDIPEPDKPYVTEENAGVDSNYPFADDSDEAQIIEELYVPDPDFSPDIWPEPDPGIIDIFSGGELEGKYPGAPSSPPPPGSPSSDTMAFYLPFHFFYPTWWGIYLVQESVQWLADYVYHKSKGNCSPRTCYSAARLFLYYHEHYHHRVESFATRLEVTHRTPLYKTSFLGLYKSTIGTSSCLEESLAEANAYLKTLSHFRLPDSRTKSHLKKAFEDFISSAPPGYREGLDWVVPRGRYKEGESLFAEENLQLAGFGGYKKKRPRIWDSASYMFRGMVDRRTRCKYLIKRSASILTRTPLAKPRYKMKQFLKKLKKLGCRFVQHRKKHDEWEGPNGRRTTIPRHSVEMAPGTMRSILRAFGLSMEQLQSA